MRQAQLDITVAVMALKTYFAFLSEPTVMAQSDYDYQKEMAGRGRSQEEARYIRCALAVRFALLCGCISLAPCTAARLRCAASGWWRLSSL